MTRLPPALVEMLPPMVQLPRAPRSSGNIRPSCSTRSWSFCSGVPACAMATPPEASTSSTLFMRSIDSTISLAFGNAAAHQPGHAALRRYRDAFAMTEPQQRGDIPRRSRADDRAGFWRWMAGEIVMIARIDVRRLTAPHPCRARCAVRR